ncbi:hypothetical protein CCR85_06470 [Rhodothalassium salexigens]|nr:hypothetical protein [Rhodothalassium salexigens]MBK5921976.1 hypothetical protein [Rhodothalassium salexigens]
MPGCAMPKSAMPTPPGRLAPLHRETALRQAAGWLARLRADDAGERDREAWRRWRDDNLMHRRAFEDVTRVWAALDGLGDDTPALPSAPDRSLPVTVATACATVALAALIIIRIL